MGMTPLPVHIGPDRLAGSLYAPVSGARAGAEAWLLPSPPGDDRKGAWLPLSRLARALAARGDWALLMDLRGCGESPGEFEEADWDGWLADIAAAADCLTKASGAGRLVWWGGRAGARLAAEGAARAPEGVARLVFWDAVFDVWHWRREWRRRSRFRLGAPAEALSDDDLDGYVFGPALSRQLAGRRDIPPRPEGVAARFLCLAASGRPSGPSIPWAAAWLAAVEAVAESPFWLAADPVEASALISATLALPPERTGE